MNTKYEIDEIIYLPFVVNRIEIEGKDFNGVAPKVKYHLIGKNAITGTYIQIDEKDTNKAVFPIKTARDFK